MGQHKLHVCTIVCLLLVDRRQVTEETMMFFQISSGVILENLFVQNYDVY